MQELFFVIGTFVELLTVMIWLSFFWLQCTARKKLGIYDEHAMLIGNGKIAKQ